MGSVLRITQQNTDLLKILTLHIGMGLSGTETENRSIDIQIRIAEINAQFKNMIDKVSTENADTFDEDQVTELIKEQRAKTATIADY